MLIHTTAICDDYMTERETNPELLELMASLILKVMKANNGYCGIADLLKELRVANMAFTYGDVITNWHGTNQQARNRALKIARLK